MQMISQSADQAVFYILVPVFMDPGALFCGHTGQPD